MTRLIPVTVSVTDFNLILAVFFVNVFIKTIDTFALEINNSVQLKKNLAWNIRKI